MLKYLVQLTNDLMSAGVIIAMLYAYIKTNFGKKGKNVLLISGGVSLIASVVMSMMKNMTAKVNIGYWNLVTFGVFIFAMIIFIVFTFDTLRKKLRSVGEYVLFVSGGVIILSLVFYCLPDVLAYPFNFDLQDKSVLSTEFLYRFIGCVLGFLVVLIAGIAAYKSVKALAGKSARGFIYTALVVNALSFAGKAIQIMITRRMLKQTAFLFGIVKFTLNYSSYFIFAILLAAVIAAVYLFAKNTKVSEEYSNPAQLRKIRARMRNQRRWSVVLVVFAIIAVVNLTVIDAYNNKAPELSPVEDSVVQDGSVYVEINESLADGHLHRFGYTTDDDIQVRFIVIKKPNSNAYGVGLDACDICGEAGYFERNGQVVCKKCDVVMNINTIGFKGGCNPIIIDYTVKDGHIIVPIKELISHQNDFKG